MSYVTELIETNIDLIENQDYKLLFTRCNPRHRGELFDILTSIGEQPIDVMKELMNSICSNSTIKHINIPDNIVAISDHAFSGCKQLKTIHLPSTVKELQYGAFSDSGLTEIELPEHLERINHSAFLYCYELESINIPDSVTYISHNAFAGCTNLKNVVLPNNLQILGDDVFLWCTNLKCAQYDNALYLGSSENPYLVLYQAVNRDITSCVIHKDTQFIHSRAFQDCMLTEISISSSIKYVGSYAFAGCKGLQIYCDFVIPPTSWSSSWRDCFSSVQYRLHDLEYSLKYYK